MSTTRFYTRLLPTLMLVLILATAAYAFADANVVPESGAGDGAGAISGYTVSAIKYNLNAANPRNLDSVEFDLSPTAGAGTPTTVTVQMNGAGTWYACAGPVGATWTCDLSATPETVLAATNLRVVAAQ